MTSGSMLYLLKGLVMVSNLLASWMHGLLAHEANRPQYLGNPVELRFPEFNVLETDRESELWMPADYSRRHNLIAGSSGGGKTRLLAGLCIDAFERGNGVTAIDSQKSLIDYLLAYFGKRYYETGDASVLERVHVVSPSYDWCPNYQPLLYRDEGIPEQYQEMAFILWRDAAVDRFNRSILRTNTAAEKELMRRLRKWLGNVVTPIATPRDGGQQLTPADVFIVLDVYDPDHHSVWSKLRDRIPRQVRLDIERLHLYQQKNRIQDIDRCTESTDNALSESFTTPYSMLFSRPDLPSIDVKEIVRRGDMLLVDTSETRYRSAETGAKIGGLFMDKVYDVAGELFDEGRPEEHDLVVDEIGDNITENVGRYFETARKFLLSITVAPQSLSTLRKGTKVDLAPEVIDCCKTVISFQAKDPETVEILGPYFAMPNRDLTERMQIMDRPAPERDEIITLVSRGQGGVRSVAQTHFTGQQVTESEGATLTRTQGAGSGLGGSRTRGWQNLLTSMFNQGSGTSTHRADGKSTGNGFTPMMVDGNILHIPTESTGNNFLIGDGTNDFESRGEGHSRGTSASQTSSWNRFWSEMFGQGISVGRGSGRSVIDGVSVIRGDTWSTTVSQQLVQRTREEWIPTGEPRFSLPYQDAAYECLLATLPDRYAFMRTKINGVERTILFRVREIPDVYGDPQEERRVVDRFLRDLYQSKAYMFTPEPPDVSQRRRIDAFLADNTAQNRSDNDRSSSDQPESGDDFR